ncbi:MAG: tRNA (adenosine(37)-N6)-threonylcarbamoyltransferase complex dimerization subunit type 1 TsaB [Spirochaetales bacterium]
MTRLVIDTATEKLLLGWKTNDALRLINVASQGNHAGDILPRLKDLLQGQVPDQIGVAVGPGSFTGLRIGLSTAKGLAEGWGCPLWPLDSLNAMATTWNRLYRRPETAVFAAIDARKQRFYGTLVHGDRVLIPVSDWSPDRWLDEITKHWSGSVALSGYQGQLMATRLGELPSGWDAMQIDDWTPALMAQLESRSSVEPPMSPHEGPFYLRLSEAEEHRLAGQRLQ